MGGGLLETNNQLERFTKNKKSKKLTYSIIGILLIIGSITLFKTYAFFEEKQEFNVLKGRVPTFIENDVTLALRLNGNLIDKVPNKGNYKVEVNCDHATGIWNYFKWKLEIEELSGGKVKCSINFIDDATITNLSYKAKLGEYVIMTPSATTFTIPSSLTGYENDQTINPSELNLWRIIKIYEDGSIDLVSQNVSSTTVRFRGKNGYKNYIGALNFIATAYENSNYTSNARYIGYNGQTSFITNSSQMDSVSAPWHCSTLQECHPENDETLGGGDNLTGKDIELIKNAIGDLRAYKINEPSVGSNYWLANRNYFYSSELYAYYVSAIAGNGIVNNHGSRLYYKNESGGYNTGDYYGLRPIVTLKPGLSILNGNGTEATPWKIN